MTTIATDGYTLAADTQQNAGGYIDRARIQKISRLPDGRLLGTAGCVACIQRLRRYLEHGGEFPADLHDDTAALLLAPEGVYYYDHHNEAVPVGAPAAIGSGSNFALGALLAGADPRRAVAIAIELDPYSGGNIVSLTLEPAAEALP